MTTVQRLSTGVRVNSARDAAAAGLLADIQAQLDRAGAGACQVGGSAAQSSGALAFRALQVEPAGSLMDVDANDPDEARRSLLRVEAALDAVGEQPQLEGETVAATRGRIVDADLGAESAALARRQVLQQAATARVAQANLQARDVLDLLR